MCLRLRVRRNSLENVGFVLYCRSMAANPAPPVEVVDVIKALIRKEMGASGLQDVRVAPGLDHDGDPVIFIDADYEPRGRPININVVAGLVNKLCDALWELGETRFPHIRHHFSEKQKIAGAA